MMMIHVNAWFKNLISRDYHIPPITKSLDHFISIAIHVRLQNHPLMSLKLGSSQSSLSIASMSLNAMLTGSFDPSERALPYAGDFGQAGGRNTRVAGPEHAS